MLNLNLRTVHIYYSARRDRSNSIVKQFKGMLSLEEFEPVVTKRPCRTNRSKDVSGCRPGVDRYMWRMWRMSPPHIFMFCNVCSSSHFSVFGRAHTEVIAKQLCLDLDGQTIDSIEKFNIRDPWYIVASELAEYCLHVRQLRTRVARYTIWINTPIALLNFTLV